MNSQPAAATDRLTSLLNELAAAHTPVSLCEPNMAIHRRPLSVGVRRLDVERHRCMNTPYTESKRVRSFRLEIAKQIPKFPNDKATLQALEASSLASLLIHFNNWAIRYVSPRPRTVSIESTATSDIRWATLSNKIAIFLDKVRNGEDLTPHLSLESHTRGYTEVTPIFWTGHEAKISGMIPVQERGADDDAETQDAFRSL